MFRLRYYKRTGGTLESTIGTVIKHGLYGIDAMPLTCNYPDCDRAVVCKGAEEVEANCVREEYECSAGHTFHKTLAVN